VSLSEKCYIPFLKRKFYPLFEDQTIEKFFQVFNNRDLDGMGALLHSNASFYFPKTQPLLGKDRILKFLKILFRQYPELSFNVARVIRQGNHAAAHWTNRGINRRQELYENEGVTIFEMEEGKIIFISDFFKDTEKW
jgi:ketosteroid isomerase-like protein